jgi:predicted HTH transcriptional regulator
LQDSHGEKVDCRPFIDFMLAAIENSLYKYVDIASETKGGQGLVRETRPLVSDDPVNDLANDPVNDPVNALLACIQDNPAYTYGQLSEKIGKSPATVKRLIQKLKADGVIVRVGSDKTGYWEAHP